MADAFSYFLPDGTPVNGTTQAPPTGTPYRQSEALVPNANGALTSTATGDAANAFRGFTSADGGGFGGYATPNPNIVGGMSMRDYDARAGELSKNLKVADWSQVDQNELKRLSTPTP